MDTLVDDALEYAGVTLEEVAGECVSFRSSSTRVVIDRLPIVEPVDPTRPNNANHQASVVKVRLCLVGLMPKFGESFTDKRGCQHRVQRVDIIGEDYYCACKVVYPTSQD